MKPAIQRALAQQDIAKAFDHYLRVAGAVIAADFVQEMDACMQRIERFPDTISAIRRFSGCRRIALFDY